MGLFDIKDGFAEKKHVVSNLVYGSINKNRKPKISILMPIYNHPQYFEQALLSALNQDCDFEYEIIVCDNNHPDYQKQNQEIAKRFECEKLFYYVNEENIGGLSNWNRCIELATADDVTYCHDDDKLLKSCLTDLYKCRTELGRYHMIIGNFETIDQTGSIISRGKIRYSKVEYELIDLWDFFFVNYTNGCGCLYCRQCLINIGGFIGDYNPCPDYCLNVKYCNEFGAAKLTKATFQYRLSNASDSAVSYINIPKANKRIREGMVEKLPSPQKLLLLLNEILYRHNKLYGIILWQENSSFWDKVYKIKYQCYRIIIRMLIFFVSFYN